MARLRQINAGVYSTSGNISAEFESIVRYLNAAEIGNKTLAELLAQLFDEDGDVDGIVELRLNQTSGLQFRSGTYAPDDQTGWRTIAALTDLRGPAGLNLGSIADPVLNARLDVIATAGQTVFAYAHEPGEELIVYRNGLLQRPGLPFDYVADPALDRVTFNTSLVSGDRVSIYKVRAASLSGFGRTDVITAAPQSVFSLPAVTGAAAVQVYRNGLLQREGGAADYTVQLAASTITFNAPLPAANLVSIVVLDTGASRPVAGLMTEGTFTDPATGMMRFDRLAIPAGAIAQDRVSGLPALASASARMAVSPTQPANIPAGQQGLWLNTAVSPPDLRVWDGSSWVRAVPATALPAFAPTDANRYLRVNSSGTALAFAPIDLSAAVPTTAVGAASGVASLDVNAKLPTAQLPDRVATETVFLRLSGAVSNGAQLLKRIWRQRLVIEGIYVATTSGTCSVEVQVNGVTQSGVIAASSTPVEQVFGSAIQVDATASSRAIGILISGAASANNLEVALACSVRSV